MSDATSGARTGRRHDRRSAYRRDGAGPERVLAWQLRHERKFYVGRHERSSGGQAARSEIGLSTRRGQHPSTRLGIAAPAWTQIRCRTPRAALGRAGGTIENRPIDATGAEPERVLALQHRHGRKFDVGRRERRSGGQAARSKIGLSTRRERNPNASWIGRSRGGGGPGTVDDEEVAEDSEEVGDKMTYSV